MGNIQMTSEPLVSIITPCYNHERYLDEYMAGLLGQTYRNIEVILFDDGSTDRSWEKILSYKGALEKRFSRVVCERHEHVGLFLELELAVKAAAGAYICFIASDDCHLPDMVETSVGFLKQNPECGIVHGDADFYFKDRLVRAYRKTMGLPVLQGNVYEQALKNHSLFVCSACFRADLIRRHVSFGYYAEMNYPVEDYPMCLDLYRITKVGYLDRSLARYRAQGDLAYRSQNPQKMLRWLQGNYRIRFTHIKRHGLPDKLRSEVLWGYYCDLYSLAYEHRIKKEFSRAYRWLIKKDPARYLTLHHYIRVFSMHSYLLWMTSRYLEKYKGIRKLRAIRWQGKIGPAGSGSKKLLEMA